jgi:hypothetical protein
MKTEEILARAIDITTGSRQEQYGPKKKNHENIAALWNAYWMNRKNPGAPLGASDVATMLGLMKVARTLLGGGTEDSYVDGAAYFAMAGELSETVASPVAGGGKIGTVKPVEIGQPRREGKPVANGTEHLNGHDLPLFTHSKGRAE